jgi:hypothetical protein
VPQAVLDDHGRRRRARTGLQWRSDRGGRGSYQAHRRGQNEGGGVIAQKRSARPHRGRDARLSCTWQVLSSEAAVKLGQTSAAVGKALGGLLRGGLAAVAGYSSGGPQQATTRPPAAYPAAAAAAAPPAAAAPMGGDPRPAAGAVAVPSQDACTGLAE